MLILSCFLLLPFLEIVTLLSLLLRNFQTNEKDLQYLQNAMYNKNEMISSHSRPSGALQLLQLLFSHCPHQSIRVVFLFAIKSYIFSILVSYFPHIFKIVFSLQYVSIYNLYAYILGKLVSKSIHIAFAHLEDTFP